jgi:GTP-binding protein HflX
VILHVRDVSHEDTEAQLHDVERVLDELGIAANDPRLIEVWNKIDALDEDGRVRLTNLAERRDSKPVLVSALTGEGMDALTAAIQNRLSHARVLLDLDLESSDGAGLSWLYRNAEVLEKAAGEEGRLAVTVRVDPTKVELVRKKFSTPAEPAARGKESKSKRRARASEEF